MNISQKGIDLIKEFEGCVLHAYRDSVGVVTIGYGTTNAVSSIIGTSIYMGMIITQAIAEEWLTKTINYKYVPLVMKYDYKYHWNQNQLDALVSFAYNLGSIDSLTNYGKRSISEISNAILLYNKAGGQVLAGLTRRRKAEKTLFDTPCVTWIQDDTGWKYKKSDGTYAKKCWLQIDDEWYYFHSNGYMASNEYVKSTNYETDKKLYYVSISGRWNNNSYRLMKNDKGKWLAQINANWYATNTWIKIGKYKYYAGKNGYFYVSTTATIGKKTYKFDGNGAVKE